MAASTSRSGGIASSSSVAASARHREVKLEKETELRIEVGPEHPLKLGLLDGTAEIFGADLCEDSWITFRPGMNFAVFTWDGATIGIDGSPAREYTAHETPMRSYCDFHDELEKKRSHAANNPASQGPRVIVIGPADSGKTSLSMMLLSWAAKQHRIPLFVDLDVEQGSITLPGCIGAIPIKRQIDPVDGIANDIDDSREVYFYGHRSPSTNVDLYKFLLKKLAQTVETRLSRSPENRAAGMIINTMGWTDGVESKSLLLAIYIFRASVVLVLDEEYQEKLYTTLKDKHKDVTTVQVVKLQKSGGVVSRNPTIRSEARNFKVREYFYGPGGDDHDPYFHTANFSDLKVFRIDHWQPETNKESTRVVADSLNMEHHFHILAISFATERNNILSSCICGFIYVKAIDLTRKRFTYLTPTKVDIPRRRSSFTNFIPNVEEIPNWLIAGSVCANLEESAPPTEEEEYIPVTDLI